jgi:hypothetical protein
LERASEEELKDDKRILFPLIPDVQFVDKMVLIEPLMVKIQRYL